MSVLILIRIYNPTDPMRGFLSFGSLGHPNMNSLAHCPAKNGQNVHRENSFQLLKALWNAGKDGGKAICRACL